MVSKIEQIQATVAQQSESLEELHGHRKKIEFAAEKLAKRILQEEDQRIDSVNRVSGEIQKVCQKIMSMEGKLNHFSGGLVGSTDSSHTPTIADKGMEKWMTNVNNRISSYSGRVDGLEEQAASFGEKIAIFPSVTVQYYLNAIFGDTRKLFLMSKIAGKATGSNRYSHRN